MDRVIHPARSAVQAAFEDLLFILFFHRKGEIALADGDSRGCP